VKPESRLVVRHGRFFGGLMAAKQAPALLIGDSGDEPVAVSIHTAIPQSSKWHLAVDHVLAARGDPQVLSAVVETVPVAVINLNARRGIKD
jgi:hypothetical protein